MFHVVKCIILTVLNDFMTRWLASGILNLYVCGCRFKM